MINKKTNVYEVVLLNLEIDSPEMVRALNDTGLFDVKGHAATYHNAIELIRAYKPDIIIMESLFLQYIDECFHRYIDGEKIRLIVAVTNQGDFVKAINSRAFGYVLKPLVSCGLTTLHRNLDLIFNDIKLQCLTELITKQPAKKTGCNKIVLNSTLGMVLKKVEDIIYLSASGNRSTARTIEGEELLLKATLKQMETKLEGHGFFRIHNSILINSKCIQYYKYENGKLEIKGGHTFEVAHRRRKEFQRFITSRY